MQNKTEDRFWNVRWHLAAVGRSDLVGIALAAVIVGLLVVMFHYLGNTVANVHSRSAFRWMVARWGDKISFGGADYSHGYLIPFVSLWVVWLRRREIAAAPKAINWLGLGVIVGALLLHWIGARMQQTRVSLFAFIVLTWGIPFFFYGWGVAKHLIFPCSYLIFCIPLNFLDAIAFPLRLLATKVSVAMLNGLGIAAERSGSAIYSAAGGGFQFDVADPCSGLRSLLAMTALTAVYAYLTQKTFIKKWILFLACIPLAIAGNIARITSIGLVAEAFGQKAALKVYHDWSGYVVFSVAIVLMVALGAALNVDYRAKWRNLKGRLAVASAA